VRALWSLPKAAPALMRHIGAYIDLAALDLASAQRAIMAQAVALAIVAICVLFAVFMACLGVVAYTWDTPYRVAAIGCMGGGFLVVAIVAAIYRSSLARAAPPLLSDVQREWQEDRVILERIIADEN
jgi:uncharacterized membrane protein YqjE